MEKIDLRKSIGIPLQEKGNSFVGFCPFHKEQTPSFVITDNGTRFECLSCGISGTSNQFPSLIAKKAK